MYEGRSKGYVRLYRQVEENEFLMLDDKAFIVFTKLLLFVGREKGQWAGGRRQLAKRMNMNDNTLYKVLKRLEDNRLIAITSNQRYSIYHICNWHKYQNVSNRLNLESVTSRQPAGNTLTRTKEINKRPADLLLNKRPEKQATEKSPGYLKFRKLRAELKV